MADTRRRHARVTAAPIMPFLWQEWKGSKPVQRMSMAERGVFKEMLILQWDKGPIPDDAGAIADLISWTESQRQETLAAWPVVRTQFVGSRRDGLIVNLKLERVRRKQREFKQSKRVAGAAGGRHKAANQLTAHEIKAGRNVAEPSRPPENPSSILSVSSSVSIKSSPSVGSGSPRPIFTGQRFTVFEWQLEQLGRLLGPHLEDFDVHTWFFDLDAQAVKTCEVIPQRDSGKWLLARTEDEARRRGLPIATTDQMGKGTQRLASALANIAREGR